MNPQESHTTALFGLAVGGLTHPKVAAAAGFLWGVGAIAYYKGYATGDPQKRYSYGGGT
jgi:glutathione S-transferase